MAEQRAARRNAHLTALHVLPAGLDTELTEFAHACPLSRLDRFADLAIAETVVRHGAVAHEILSEAADRGADLLVVGAHGGHWPTSPLLGSTPDNPGRASPVPVLVVENPPGASMVPEIDQHAFAVRLAAGDAVVIDVRESHEFRPAHVPGARNLPLSVLPARMTELPKNRPIYVICQSGRRSAQAAAAMRAAGLNATNVAGGTGEWIRSGRTVETSDR